MYPIMPDQNHAVIENQYRSGEREREIAQIRLAEIAQPSSPNAPAAVLLETQTLTRFRRSAAAIAALFLLH